MLYSCEPVAGLNLTICSAIPSGTAAAASTIIAEQ